MIVLLEKKQTIFFICTSYKRKHKFIINYPDLVSVATTIIIGTFKMSGAKDIIIRNNPKLHKQDVYNLESYEWWYDYKTFTHTTWRYRNKIINCFTMYNVSIATICNVICIFVVFFNRLVDFCQYFSDSDEPVVHWEQKYRVSAAISGVVVWLIKQYFDGRACWTFALWYSHFAASESHRSAFLFIYLSHTSYGPYNVINNNIT